MPTFTDDNKREWSIRFDGVLLGELRDATGIDLADVGGESWVKLETDQSSLTKAVCFLCREQLAAKGLTERQLSESLSGESAESALQALWGAAKVFFRPKLLSVLQSAYSQRMEAQEQWNQLRPMLTMLNQPEMPEAMLAAIWEQLTTTMEGMAAIGSQPSSGNPSATGPAPAPSKPATALPASAELSPAA